MHEPAGCEKYIKPRAKKTNHVLRNLDCEYYTLSKQIINPFILNARNAFLLVFTQINIRLSIVSLVN